MRQLTVSIGDTERTLKESNERENMAVEDRISMHVDWAASRREAAILREVSGLITNGRLFNQRLYSSEN